VNREQTGGVGKIGECRKGNNVIEEMEGRHKYRPKQNPNNKTR
jgi:hypothetical protein